MHDTNNNYISSYIILYKRLLDEKVEIVQITLCSKILCTDYYSLTLLMMSVKTLFFSLRVNYLS